MQRALITIEVPLPDEAEQKDADALSRVITRLALTTQPTMGMSLSLTPKVFGRVTKVKLKGKKKERKCE